MPKTLVIREQREGVCQGLMLHVTYFLQGWFRLWSAQTWKHTGCSMKSRFLFLLWNLCADISFVCLFVCVDSSFGDILKRTLRENGPRTSGLNRMYLFTRSAWVRCGVVRIGLEIPEPCTCDYSVKEKRQPMVVNPFIFFDVLITSPWCEVVWVL